MQTRLAIGLSSGSSQLGIQAALVEAQGTGLEMRLRLAHCLERSYPAELRQWLLRCQADEPATPKQTALVHRVLGGWFANTAAQLIDEAKVNVQRVWCVGLSEQTIWQEVGGRNPTTLGLGMPEVIAEKTGLTTLSRFRARDLATGGNGLLPAALVDRLLFQDDREDRLLLHLGGWATLLWLPAGGGARDLIGLQAAPCGLLLDSLMRRLTNGKEAFDAWGKHGVQGRCIDALLGRWLTYPGLQRKPPRALALEEFGEAFSIQAVTLARSLERSLHDILCTASHFVARAVGLAVERFLPRRPRRVILSGCGVRNGFLLRLLEQQFGTIALEKTDQYGWPIEARQAAGHAALALLALDGAPANVPAVTGAAGPRVCGGFTPGSTQNWARCLAWMAQQSAVLPVAA